MIAPDQPDFLSILEQNRQGLITQVQEQGGIDISKLASEPEPGNRGNGVDFFQPLRA